MAKDKAKNQATDEQITREKAQNALNSLQQHVTKIMDNFAGEQGRANLKVLSQVQDGFNECIGLIQPIVQRNVQLEAELTKTLMEFEKVNAELNQYKINDPNVPKVIPEPDVSDVPPAQEEPPTPKA